MAAVLYADSGIPEDVQNMLGNFGELGKAFQSMLVTAEKLGRLPEVLRTFNEKISEGFQTFRTNWNAICKSIYALNPDVTLVAVGFFNPVKTLRLSSTQPQIGQMMDPIARRMNNFVRYQADYARQYLYADVYNTECYELVPVDDPAFGSTLVPAVHPTHEGHKYMAEQIVKVLPEKEEPKPCDGGENCPSKAFTDVDRSADSWMHEPIDWAVTNEITNGTGEHTFSPDAACTRAQPIRPAPAPRSRRSSSALPAQSRWRARKTRSATFPRIRGTPTRSSGLPIRASPTAWAAANSPPMIPAPARRSSPSSSAQNKPCEGTSTK